MRSSAQLMQAFRAELQRRADLIKRGGMLSDLIFGPVKDQAFTVRAVWPGGECSRTYTYSSVFQYTGTRPPRIRGSMCRYRRELVQEILRKRGV